MHCFACQGAVELRPGERIGRRDVCARCGADLHVCLNCRHHDPHASNACREPQAEWVSDRERANLCEWFSPAPGRAAGSAGRPERDAAREALDALFKKR